MSSSAEYVLEEGLLMSNVHNLFDHKQDDPLIVEYLKFIDNKCANWLDEKRHENLHSDEVLKAVITIRKLITNSDELRTAYANFMMHFKQDDSVEFGRWQKAID